MSVVSRVKSWFNRTPDRSAMEAVELRNRCVALEVENRVLTESCYGGVPGWVEQYNACLMANYPDRVAVGTVSNISDRRGGRDFPFYISETDLNIYRMPARILCKANNYAIGLVRGLTSYVIGKGFTYRWQSKGVVRGTKRARDDAKNPLVRAMQEIWDEFAHREALPELEQELYGREREDGEAFLSHGIHPNTGRCWVRTIEPEQVYRPTWVSADLLAEYHVDPAKAVDAWNFGILTDPEDVATRYGYAVHNLLNPVDFDFIGAHYVVHSKTWPRRRSIKRGMTDFSFDTLDALAMAQRLRRALGIGATVQASMAGIRQHSEASAAQVTAFQQVQTQRTLTAPNGQPINIAGILPGTIYDMDGQSNFVPPPSAANGTPHLEILQACLRGASQRYLAPEWLGSGLHDTGSFASTLTAESPFVKSCIMEQEYYLAKRMRTAMMVRLFAVEQGFIDPKALAELECAIEPPHVQVRDPEQQARVDQIYAGLGVKSKQQIDLEQGWDYDEQTENIKEDAKQNPPQPPPGGAAGGGPPMNGAPPLPQDRAGKEPPQPQREGREPELIRSVDATSPVAARLTTLRESYGEAATAAIVEAAGRLIRVPLLENFTGIDAHNHHWVQGKQVTSEEYKATAGSTASGEAVGAPTEPAAKKDAPEHAAAEKWVKAASGLSPETAAKYTADLAHALSKLPTGVGKYANAAINHRQGGIKLHGDLATLRGEAVKINGKNAAGVAGFAHDRGEGTEVHLDGGEDAKGTYVHELWHAADNGGFHSDDKGWQAAYLKDIKKGKHLLSRYALVNSSEGFAEFGRVLSEHGEAHMAKHFPTCMKHLKAKGLV